MAAMQRIPWQPCNESHGTRGFVPGFMQRIPGLGLGLGLVGDMMVQDRDLQSHNWQLYS